MRADATKAENLLWQALRNKQLEGLKFKWQVTIGGSHECRILTAAV